jgi:hypothetical protein
MAQYWYRNSEKGAEAHTRRLYFGNVHFYHSSIADMTGPRAVCYVLFTGQLPYDRTCRYRRLEPRNPLLLLHEGTLLMMKWNFPE